jgi:ABC-type branched-subunit amino acid transport system substrate-binding protein
LTSARPNPDKINYIRVAATGRHPGSRRWPIYDYNTLGLKNMLVVDDVTTFGKGVADNFQKKFEELGGKVTARRGRQGHDRLQLDHHQRQGSNPDWRLLRWRRDLRCGLLLKQLRQQGLNDPVHRT